MPPSGGLVSAGSSLTLTVTASGSPTLSYQWRLNGTNVPGATNSSLTLTNVQATDAGEYTVVVWNNAGLAVSPPAVLSVRGPQPNLVPYRPPGWSESIVVAADPASLTNTPVLYDYQGLVLRWAVANLSTNAGATPQFLVRVYLDGQLRYSAPLNGLNPLTYTFWTNVVVGSLPAGTHTLQLEVDPTDVIAESNEGDNSYTKTFEILAQPLPNLRPYRPGNWGDALVISTTTDTSTDSPVLYDHQDIYLDWAFLNESRAPISERFVTRLYVDGQAIVGAHIRSSWFFAGST